MAIESNDTISISTYDDTVYLNRNINPNQYMYWIRGTINNPTIRIPQLNENYGTYILDILSKLSSNINENNIEIIVSIINKSVHVISLLLCYEYDEWIIELTNRNTKYRYTCTLNELLNKITIALNPLLCTVTFLINDVTLNVIRFDHDKSNRLSIGIGSSYINTKRVTYKIVKSVLIPPTLSSMCCRVMLDNKKN